jgi:glyoxylase-like metal-dependent hydrolase (beta-lactamase superfamily II)
MGRKIEAPTPIFLIDHPRGKVLFETGIHPNVSQDPAGHWGQRATDLMPIFDPEQAADRQLLKIGVDPEDIKYVILSCLYPDHAGGMHLFPNATFVVQFRELQDAWWPDTRLTNAYEYKEIAATRYLKYRELHDEDLDLFGDGSINILFTPAHTRGEQSVVLRLPRTGTVVFPAGIMPQRANFEDGIMTGTPMVAPEVVHASMHKLRSIAERENALIIFHHDMAAWREIKKVPEYYD